MVLATAQQPDARAQLGEWFQKLLVQVEIDREPEAVQQFVRQHAEAFARTGSARKLASDVHRELLRALGILPSTERRRSERPTVEPKGPGAAGEQPQPAQELTEEERLEKALLWSTQNRDWHKRLCRKRERQITRLRRRLARMTKQQEAPVPPAVVEPEDDDDEFDFDAPLSPEEEAAIKEDAEAFGRRLTLGNGADPSLVSVKETLMPSGAVQQATQQVTLAAQIPADLASGTVVNTRVEQRSRYDFSVVVTRVELAVEKKVVVAGGQRHVISASTSAYGPPGWSVTWNGMSTLAVLVAQFALPFNRLGTMLSSPDKRFNSAQLSRMFLAVARRLVPIYLELGKKLAGCQVLAGDDTGARVLEVTGYFDALSAATAQGKDNKDRDKRPPIPPWAEYRTSQAAEAAMKKCEETRRTRLQQRRNGDRNAKATAAEIPTLGMLIGSVFPFESARRNGEGAKTSLNVSVISGRVEKEDPHSLIVFYRSHLGSYGNALEHLLRYRDTQDQKLRTLVTQGDLSTSNRVVNPDLLSRFKVKTIGCGSHARRPFANYEHEAPEFCGYMLHLFGGLAMIERRLDVHGRNKENVLAVRRNEGREYWEDILTLAKDIAEYWPSTSKVGAGARYIINHYGELTAYLDDPHLEPSNNLRERMLRLEKLIEGASMFRKSLEGRFALDVVRTVVQTAVAAGVPVHEYLTWVLSGEPADVAEYPARFTPRAWAALRAAEAAEQDPPANPA